MRGPVQLAVAVALALAAPVQAADTPKDEKAGPAWLTMSAGDRRAAGDLADQYMKFLGSARVPVQRAAYLADQAAFKGFKPLTESTDWKPGQRFYLLNRGRALMLGVVGKQPLKEGVRLIAAHLDSPRLEVRIRPIRTSESMVMLMTAPYGGVKRYQWANLPLALVGQVARADGKVVDVAIGDKPSDPVFVLPDLAPHVDKEMRTRTQDQIFKGDELGPLAASMPAGPGGSTKQAFLDELKNRYGLVEEDFVSAELSFVPAGPPREVGLDRALVGGYGQDDGLCSFVGVQAITELSGNPEHTTLVYLVDHEEVGNINNAGVRSRFLEGNLGRMLTREAKGKVVANDALATMLDHTEALSADVSQGLNPLFPGTEDPLNTAKLGFGLTIKNMRPGFDGSPQLRSRLRRVLAKDKIPWQTYAYKVDGGGGGTIGADLQELNMDVVDVGVPLLAMHGTFELSSKADVYALKRFFGAFMRGN